MSETKEAKEQQMLSPVERAIQRAQKDLANYQQDMLAAGISEEQIRTVVTKAEERVRKEYEERENQDPCVLLGSALTTAAQSEEEIALAHFYMDTMEWNRAEWQRKFHEEQINYTRSGGQGNLNTRRFMNSNSMRQSGGGGRTVGTIIMETKTRKPLKLPGDENEPIIPSKEFQERVLRNLGILNVDETFDVLRALPEHPKEPDGPHSERNNYATPGGEVFSFMDLPTNISGIKITVHTGNPKQPFINASLDESALEKVLMV